MPSSSAPRLPVKARAGILHSAAVAGSVLMLAACPPSSGSTAATVPITPVCTVLCEVASTGTISWNGQVFVAERTDPAIGGNFTAFRPMSNPRGNPAIGFTNPTGVPDTYGIREAWLRWPGSPEVHRAQATPAGRTTSAGPDFFASSWNINAQDATGTWSGAFAFGSANRGDEPDPPEVGAVTVPQLMPVGLANPQMFACAGGRAEDNSERTTNLIESIAPRAGAPGRMIFIQDLLNGDDRFIPNRPIPAAPLSPAHTGPANPPSPTMSGPGDPIRKGAVQCAMVQLDDDLATRELHMIAIDNGVLYHSMANNWGPVTDGTGAVFNRLRTVTPWGDVGQANGGGFGTITSAAIVAYPSAISIFFIAESGGRYRLWHAVRFSSGGGSWRAIQDVFSRSGDAANGSVYPFYVSAGICPEFGATVWDAASTETLVALRGGSAPLDVLVIRVVSTPRQWRAGVNGVYSPWQRIPLGAMGAGTFILRNVVVSARPFRDNSTPTNP